MPTRTALRLCPQGILVHPRFAVYGEVSRQLRAVFLALTPVIEPISLDEAFLDISALVGSPTEGRAVALDLKRRVQAETELTASIGIAANKLVAKVASDRDKPDGLTIVPRGEEAAFLAPLPVRRLFGIGPRTEERLRSAGIERVEQLAGASPQWLVGRFGQSGLEWQRMAQGVDDRPVLPDRELKQISRERTFPHDLDGREELRRAVSLLAEELLPSLQDAPPARTITLKMRYPDLSIATRRHTPGVIIGADTLSSGALRLFEESWDGRPLRLMGLGISNFVVEPEGQLSLFGEDGPLPDSHHEDWISG
jgi:DNA polymerase-4